jgi:succinate-acetate transporter protein
MQTSFVILSYAITFGGIGALVAGLFRHARRLAAQLPDEERPWI